MDEGLLIGGKRLHMLNLESYRSVILAESRLYGEMLLLLDTFGNLYCIYDIYEPILQVNYLHSKYIDYFIAMGAATFELLIFLIIHACKRKLSLFFLFHSLKRFIKSFENLRRIIQGRNQ